MKLKGKKIGVLIESDFYEHEIWYYNYRFPEEGAELHFLTRMWGQPSITFKGHEYHAPFDCNESFEDMDDDTLRSFDAIIVPSGMVSDRLRYSEDVGELPPATSVGRLHPVEVLVAAQQHGSARQGNGRCIEYGSVPRDRGVRQELKLGLRRDDIDPFLATDVVEPTAGQ